MGIGGKKGKGRGKGGGGHIQIQNIEELEMQNAKVDAAKAARRDRRGPSDDEESDSDKEDEGGASESVFDKMERLEKEKKGAAPKPAKKLNGGGEKTIKNKDIAAAMAASPGGDQSTGGMNKKEREADAANKAKEAYMLKTLAGETEEARR